MSAKVSLIVVQGKPEGKVIPLATPLFRIGRGEGCHLRPNNEQVSRNHAEIEQTEQGVVLRDLGSRNGTYLNTQRLEPNSEQILKNKDLVQVGPLTFAVSIQGAVAAASAAPTAAPDKSDRAMAKAASLDELSNDDIDSWLVTDKDSAAPPERPSGVYTGDTMTFSSFQEASKSDHQVPAAPAEPEAAAAPEVEPEAAAEPEPEAEAEAERQAASAGEDDLIYDKLDDEYDPDAPPEAEEFVDESNPFFSAKKEEEEQPASAKKKEEIDSSRAAEDILRKMMERRRASR
ncbi:FHA domain-containing protein [Tautonia sp. JC769]|uniref:FHA domain-containing protein n=1 Tax=Tautonia sp. JC769 TaxID=3232135 RepID=UPI0034592FEA